MHSISPTENKPSLVTSADETKMVNNIIYHMGHNRGSGLL
jgi:hypothetical protein